MELITTISAVAVIAATFYLLSQKEQLTFSDCHIAVKILFYSIATYALIVLVIELTPLNETFYHPIMKWLIMPLLALMFSTWVVIQVKRKISRNKRDSADQ